MGINHRPRRQWELKLNGKLTQDPAEIAVAFNEYFINSVSETEQNFTLTSVNILKVDESKPSFSIQPISELKSQHITQSLETSTAKDIYGMDSTMLKSLKVHLAYPITQTINLSVLQGIFPSAWKTAIVSPMFKSGDPWYICNNSPTACDFQGC